MISVKDINYTCRLCLCKSENCVSLFENNGHVIVDSLASIKIKKDENLPFGACNKCWTNIKLAYDIQQNIKECDKKLRLIGCVKTSESNILQNIKVENESSDPELSTEPVERVLDVIIKNEKDSLEENELLEKVSISLFEAKCSICGAEMENSELSGHIKEHFSQPQKCDICNVHFRNVEDFQTHVENEHPLNHPQSFACRKCSATFKYKSFYKIHRKKAHETSKSRKRKDKLKPGEEFQCNECKKILTTEKSLWQHKKRHIKITCPICKAKCLPGRLKKHVANHSASKTVCHLCGMIAKNEESLKSHIYKVHSNKELHPCSHCEKVFKKTANRDAHIKRYHIGEMDYICDICGKGFYRIDALNKHNKMTHLKLRPHVCEFCKKSFYSGFSLRAHLRQHTNDTPFQCDECGAGFKHNVSLKTHKKSKHNIEEEKKYCCKVCGKAFASDMAVSCHMKQH